MRYAKPRTLQTKRGRRKAEQNAWCIKCRVAMAKHGTFFQCNKCRWTVQVTGISFGRKKTFAEYSLAGTTPTKFKDRWIGYPYCLHCKRRMQRYRGLGYNGFRCGYFRCGYCGTGVVEKSSKAGRIAKRKQVLDLLNQGYPMCQVEKMAHTNWRILQEMIAVATPRLCQCGLPFYHKRRCNKRRWQSVVANGRPFFDELLININRRLQSGLPEEVKLEMAQMVLLDIMQDIDVRLSKKEDYLRRYKKMYPQQLSLDDNYVLADRLEG